MHLKATSIAVCLAAFAPVASAQCPGAFSAAFTPCDLDKAVRASIVFDDGSGPALIVGGEFKTAAGLTVNQIARWDGVHWSAMGQGLGSPTPSSFAVTCFTVFDDDGPGPNPPALYAGGPFTIGGLPGVIKWNGTTWTLVPGSPQADCMAVFDDDDTGPHLPALYVGGPFDSVNGAPANRIARWDGATWTDVGVGLSGSLGAGGVRIYSLCVNDDDGPGPLRPALYAGGYIAFVNGEIANHAARWDGSAWSTLAGGVTGIVTSLLSWDADGSGPALAKLIASGSFTFAGGIPARFVASWNGASWSALGAGPQLEPKTMLLLDEDGPGPGPQRLWVGSTGGVERYDGSAWTTQFAVGNSTTSTAGVFGVQTLCEFTVPGEEQSRLFVAGAFRTIGSRGVNFITSIGPNGPESLGGGAGLNRAAEALAIFDDDGPGPRPPALYVGGDFWAAGTSTIPAIARWNPGPAGGGSWEALDQGLKPMSSQVRMLAVYDEDGPGPAQPCLYVGGALVLQEGNISCSLARWDGAHWTAITVPQYFVPYSLAVADPDGDGPFLPALFALGYSETSSVWRFDPATLGWIGLGAPFPPPAHALAAYDDDGPGPNPTRLYVGTAGHTGTPDSIHVWSGSTWDILSGGVAGEYSEVDRLLVMDDDGPGSSNPSLYLGGVFQRLGGYQGVFSPSVGRWRGTWLDAAGGLDPNFQAPGVGTHAIASFTEPGSSLPTLYASAYVDSPANLFRWTPGDLASSWTPVSTGTTGSLCCANLTGPLDMLEFDDDGSGPLPSALYIAGSFTAAGGLPSFGIARWSCPALCYANCDNSTATPLLTANDFQCFLNKFAAADSYANCDGSTSPPVLTANDFQCFLNSYAAGCP